MALSIFQSCLPRAPIFMAAAEDMAAAEAWVRDYAGKFPCDPEVIFELDSDNPGCADAVILSSGCPIFIIEPKEA